MKKRKKGKRKQIFAKSRLVLWFAKWGLPSQSTLPTVTGVRLANGQHMNVARHLDTIQVATPIHFTTTQQHRHFGFDQIYTCCMMANTVHTLPKFLLPRLSWSAPVGQQFSRASVATAQASSQRPWQSPKRSLHTERTVPKTLTTRVPRYFVSPLQQPELRRAFHASAPRRRDHHFDTLKFVQRLQSEGFTEEQSVAIMKVLNDVIQERSV